MKNNDIETVKRLNRAGVGLKYHRLRLDELGDAGKYLKERLSDPEWRMGMEQGKFFSLVGDNSYDLLFVLARACSLKGLGVKVLDLGEIVDELAGRNTLPESFFASDCKVIFITRFFERGECPLSPPQLSRVSYAILDRIKYQAPICVQTPFQRLKEAEIWWGATVIKKLGESNEELICKK